MSNSSPPESGETRKSDINRLVGKLTKINAALMQRVERSMDQQANSFSLFQTAINQEAQIRLRTEQLNNALSNLARANHELSTARDAAERANVFKTRFFTAVGHDVLQPLHAARLNLSELTHSQTNPADQRLVANISNALNSIEELLTSILDISKLEAGVFVPNIQAVSLGEVFERLAISLEPLTRRKGLELRWRPTTVTVLSDPLMLRRMIQNLLANAVHYTDRGGVLLGARRRGESVRIEVWDSGPGIAPAEQNRIFDEFQRGAASQNNAGAGFGLGLAIVKRMGDALGHILELETRVGSGSRFSIVATYAGEAKPGAAAAPLRGSAAETRLSHPVLVIDNDLAVLEAMQTILQRWGSDIRLARDLDDVAEVMAGGNFRPAIILADYHLDQGVVGLDAVAMARRITGANIPAILITADHSEATGLSAQEAGCEVLHKPVRPAELRALMQHLLRN
jgi:two-component system, sensor histidine kinase